MYNNAKCDYRKNYNFASNLFHLIILPFLTISLNTSAVCLSSSQTIINCGKDALNLILEMIPMLALWMGLMKIAEESGLLKVIAKNIETIKNQI